MHKLALALAVITIAGVIQSHSVFAALPAGCTGNPHDLDSGPTGNPHDASHTTSSGFETGNPHDSFPHHHEHIGGSHPEDICPGSNPPAH